MEGRAIQASQSRGRLHLRRPPHRREAVCDGHAHLLRRIGHDVARLRGARWDEIESDVWVILAKRMKAGKEHKVPMSNRALAILAELPR